MFWFLNVCANLVMNDCFQQMGSLLKFHNVIVLCAFFSKTAPPILMKLCMWLGYVQGKVLVPLAALVIAPFKRKAAGGRLSLASLQNVWRHSWFLTVPKSRHAVFQPSSGFDFDYVHILGAQSPVLHAIIPLSHTFSGI